VALAGLCLACAPDHEIRNVVLVSLDAVGAKHVGAYGYQRDTTPHLDAVARRGVLFENAYTQQTWTLTSHLTIMTGVHPRVHGASKTRRSSPAATTLAEILSERGFTTAAFTGAKGFMHPGFGLGRGFDSYEMGVRDSRINTPAVVEWLREQARRNAADPEHRFLLFVHYYDAHSDSGTPVPYHVPGQMGRRYVPEGRSWDRKGATGLLLDLARHGFTDLDREFVSAYYDAGVRYVDEHGVGALDAALHELDLAGETLLVITADHGEEILEHGSVLHGQPYQEIARVPLVVRGPGIPDGTRITHLAALVDLMPTILSLLSLPTPAHVQGRDLTPLLHGGGPVNDAVYLDGGQHGDVPYKSTVIADLDGRRWSYVNRVGNRLAAGRRVFFPSGSGELYALDEDPDQQRDLAAEEPDLTRRLEEQLLVWYRTNDDLAQRLRRGAAADLLSAEDKRHLEALGYVE
jgi:arylsulfatase A-like enzyme